MTQTIDLKSGESQQWAVLEESSFAKAVMDLAHSPNDAEGKGIAEDLMGMIASFVPYSEFAREFEADSESDASNARTAPAASAPASAEHTPTAAPSIAVPTVNVDALPKAQGVGDGLRDAARRQLADARPGGRTVLSDSYTSSSCCLT